MLHIKQGGSFLLTCNLFDETGAPLNLNATLLVVALKTSTGVQVGPATITPTSTPGQAIVLGLASDTANWPVGILQGQIDTSGSGLVIKNNTFMLFVEKSIT